MVRDGADAPPHHEALEPRPRQGNRRNSVQRGIRRAQHRAGLVATAVCDHPEIHQILAGLEELDYQVSVSSLRLDQISPELLDALVRRNDQQIAIAPETGSDRLRRVINKDLTNEQIVEIADMIFERGILNVKLYMMIGLPTEEDEEPERHHVPDRALVDPRPALRPRAGGSAVEVRVVELPRARRRDPNLAARCS